MSMLKEEFHFTAHLSELLLSCPTINIPTQIRCFTLNFETAQSLMKYPHLVDLMKYIDKESILLSDSLREKG